MQPKKNKKGSAKIINSPSSSAKVTQSINACNDYVVGHDKKFKWPKSLQGSQKNAVYDCVKCLKIWPVIGLDIKQLRGQPQGTLWIYLQFKLAPSCFSGGATHISSISKLSTYVLCFLECRRHNRRFALYYQILS